MNLAGFHKKITKVVMDTNYEPKEVNLEVREWISLLEDAFTRYDLVERPLHNSPDLDNLVLVGVKVRPMRDGVVLNAKTAMALYCIEYLQKDPELSYFSIDLGPFRYPVYVPGRFG